MENVNIHIREHLEVQFEKTKRLLLPNETIEFACEESDGFLILTDRRLIRSWHKQESEGFRQVIPLDCIDSLQETTKDHWEFYGIEVEDDGVLKGKEKKGEIQYDTKKEKIRPPTLSKTEKDQKTGIYSEWDNTLRNLSINIKKMQEQIQSLGSEPPKRDYTYLEGFPDTVKDSPHFERILLEKDRLDEARHMLGDSPIVFNDTVSQLGVDLIVGDDSRSETGKEKYEGFAVGEKGIVLVGYSKRELSNEEYRNEQTYGGNTGPKIVESSHLFSYDKIEGISSKW